MKGLSRINFRNIIVLLVIAGTYFVLWILTRKEIPASNKDLFNVLTGMVFNATIGRVMRALFPEKEEKPKQNDSEK